MAAEGRVLEEPRDELVVLDLVDVLLLQGALPLPVHHPLLGPLDAVRLLVVVRAHVTAVDEKTAVRKSSNVTVLTATLFESFFGEI